MSVDIAIDQLPLLPLAQGWPVLGNAVAMQQDMVAFLLEQYKRLGPRSHTHVRVCVPCTLRRTPSLS
ncbi:MAG: hypothetical protein JO125_11880 [Chloroflexi bacterium]|nr:hypothetical protein [Ktedonobacteraceae bacterium]MBV8822820.1 hypothetical protein [Ktedonobacteraceae bacterium]MBV9020150.1 hypothetical protein [Ktedonobacteraceae bacterium]MBV9708094.1 hypothetical protein [Chloroflexota bacterium]